MLHIYAHCIFMYVFMYSYDERLSAGSCLFVADSYFNILCTHLICCVLDMECVTCVFQTLP